MLEDGAVDYTDAILLSELNDALTTKFQELVVDTNSGYWLQQLTVTTTSGVASIRIPPRSIGLGKVEIAPIASSIDYQRLDEVAEGHADLFERSASSLGTPYRYVVRGDQLVLLPTPNAAYSLKISYYIRPSRLVTSQNNVSGIDRGRITSIANLVSARQITVNAIPFDQLQSSPAVIASNSQLIDVVHPDGWQELALVSSPQTYVGTTITLGGTADTSRIAVGDYVRAADQSDWPPLPVDYHRCVVDIASVKVLIQRDFQNKAAGYATDVGADLGRFNRLIARRVFEQPRKPRAELRSLRRFW